MLALVTGSTGFIGSHLVDELLRQGIGVRIVVRPSSDLKFLPQDKIEVRTGQLQDPTFMREAVAGVDYIFHVAGTLVARDLEGFRDVNVKPTRLLLEAAVQTPGFKRFVLVSSQGASGPSKDGRPLTEDDLPNPVSDYGRTKLEAEYVALEFKDRVPVTIVRPSAVYGPRDSNFVRLMRNLQQGFLPRFGKAERYTNLVHARDLAQGLIRAAESPNTVGQVYFVSNDRIYSYDEFVTGMEAALGCHARRPVVPEATLGLMGLVARLNKRLTGKVGLMDEQRIATVRERFWTADVSKMRRDFGWVPPTPLEAGLKETVAWYRQEGWIK